MVTRTISLADDAYDELAALKRRGESFSEVVRRLAKKERRDTIWSYAGAWAMDEKEAEDLIARIYAEREASERELPDLR